MLKFRPEAYSDSDLRAFIYTGTSSVLEGAVVYQAASSTAHKHTCTLFSALATLPPAVQGSANASLALPDKGKYFLMYKEDPDIENIGATIDQNDHVIGFALKAGNEFMIHKSATYGATLKTYTSIGMTVAVSTTGKLCARGVSHATRLFVGECIGTFNSEWLRVRVK
jgi:hypothetical protein